MRRVNGRPRSPARGWRKRIGRPRKRRTAREVRARRGRVRRRSREARVRSKVRRSISRSWKLGPKFGKSQWSEEPAIFGDETAGSVAVVGLGHDAQIAGAFQELPNPCPHHGVIVGQEYGDRLGHILIT